MPVAAGTGLVSRPMPAISEEPHARQPTVAAAWLPSGRQLVIGQLRTVIGYRGSVPATATVTVQRHVLSLALVPGVTGRSDVFAGRREAVLAALRPALQSVRSLGGTITVVAPALIARTTTDTRPDLGASGYLPPAQAASSASTSPHSALHAGVAHDGVPGSGPALHVTASAAVALLRLAGWTGAITTHEIGAAGGVSAEMLVPGAVARSARTASGAAPPEFAQRFSMAPGAHLLLFACARPDGVLPVGASPSLAEAEQRTHTLYREVVALS